MRAASSGLRHPASASCLGRHARLAGRCPNNSSLFPPLAAVVVVAAEELLIIRAMSGSLWAARHCVFTRGVVKANGSCRACFLRKQSRGGRTSSPSPSAHCVRIHLSQRERLWRNRKVCTYTGKFAVMPRALPLGELARQRLRGRARCRGVFFVPNSTFWGENRKRLSKVHKKAAQSLAGAGLTVPGREYLRNNGTN